MSHIDTPFPGPAPQSQWLQPLFDARHREAAQCLADWLPKQTVDERDDRAACREWVKLLGANQWLRYAVPAGPDGAWGGLFEALDARALVVLREGLAYHSPLADFAFAMQGLGSGAIALSNNTAMQNQWLPRVARGDAIAAFALSEEGAGSDVAAMKTIAACAGFTAHNAQNPSKNETWHLHGSKAWISNGGIADFYTVFAKACAPGQEAERGTANMLAFVLPAGTPGLTDNEHTTVMAPHPLATLRFDGCALADAQRLCESGEGFKLAMRTLDVFRTSVAAAAIGMARRALAEAVRHAQGRSMFGSNLAGQQLAQAKLGQMHALTESGAQLTYRAAWARDASTQPAAFGLSELQGALLAQQYTAAAASAKYTATENAQRVIDMALQMHGGHGVRVGSKVEQLYRDIRALRIYEGASEVQELIMGKAALKGGMA